MCLCHSVSLSTAAIAASICIVVAIFAAGMGLIWFPVKRLIKSKRKKTITI